MKQAFLTLGLPLSGKTTYINRHYGKAINENYLTYVSADEIKENHPDYNPDKAYLLHEYSVTKAEELMDIEMKAGRDVIMDTGGINNSYTMRIIDKLKFCGYTIKLIHIKTPLYVCLKRNLVRERKVPDTDIIYKAQREMDQYYRLRTEVSKIEVVDHFTNKNIFVDMDGVLASYRTLPISNGKIDFVNNRIFANLEPVMPIIDKLLDLQTKGYKLRILSASPNSLCQEQKNQWLNDNFNINPQDRFFVSAGRHKAEMLESLRVKFKLDKKDVTLLDDYHSTLYAVQDLDMNPMHPSEFLTKKFKYDVNN